MDLSTAGSLLAPLPLLVLTSLGFVIGALTGLFGVGGGFLLTPLLNILLGLPYPIAVGSSLCFIIGTSAGGMMRHHRMGNVDFKLLLIMAGGSVCGSILGAQLNAWLAERLGSGGSEAFTILLHCLFILMLSVTVLLLVRPPDEHAGLRQPMLQRWRLRPRIALPASRIPQISLVGIVAIGLVTGLLTGLMGIGGGVLLMPVLLLMVGQRAHLAIGTSLGVVLSAAIAGTVKHGLDGNASLTIAMPLLIGSAIGLQLGAKVCHRLNTRRLTRWFSLLVVLVIVMLIWDLLRTAR